MSNTDPSFHRQRERQFIEHVQRLLADDRLRLDTTSGRRPVTIFRRDVDVEDHEVDLKRLMAELNLPDRELQARMPTGQQLTVTLSRSWLLILRKTVGRLKVICASPTRDLLQGSPPRPLNTSDVKAILSDRAGAAESQARPVPTTVVILSTGGFTMDAHELAERRADRTLILVEPNAAGGWTVTGPNEMQAVVDLFDPEVDADKRRRIREELGRCRADILHGGISAEHLASATKLPLPLVEDEIRLFARESPGLVAKRLEGRIVLYSHSTLSAPSGGSDMPFIERVKALFGVKGETEKKVELLSERRATLSLQRDRSFEEMNVLETRESELRQQFKDTTSTLTKKRITSQLVQLRKDLERRQQLLGMLNQQINVISTHLHNLELVQQGQAAQLPDSETLASDAAAAEEALAELQAASEVASTVSATGATGMTEEEQALYEELEREFAPPSPAATQPTQPQVARATPPPVREPASPPPIPAQPERNRREAEPG